MRREGVGVNKRIPVKGCGGGRAVGWRPWYPGAEEVVGWTKEMRILGILEGSG